MRMLASLDKYHWATFHREPWVKTHTSNLFTLLFIAVYLLLWTGRKGKN